MKKLNLGTGMLLGGLLVLTLSAKATLSTGEKPTIVVGTFDSRAVAVAYVRSQAFSDYLRAQQGDVQRVLQRAREAGDDQLAAELEALGPAIQLRIHRQGFGTAPVDDILAHIEKRLPAIAEQAGVDVIVSKWNLVHSGPRAQFVDVSLLLATEFQPDEKTLAAIREIMTTQPVPTDQLAADD